ncbi:MAG: ATP-binding cassette domain-containing protein [Phycisphaerales bacterium]|nr:ATP-binding cassette domain-containing protein [Phycisphaerales bacterium]
MIDATPQTNDEMPRADETMPQENDDVPLLAMSGISKRFGGAAALSGVDFSVRAGEVHALMGENGAGKSTLIRILTGVHRADAGEIVFNGSPFQPRSPAEALAGGVSTIHQELNLIPTLSVAENLLIGRMPRGRFGLDWREARARARRILRDLGIDVDVDRRLDDCSTAVRQMVAIARAVSVQSRLVVMDEPTSSLDRPEARRLLERVKGLRRTGVAVVFISHSLQEVYAVSDRMTVLRNGRLVGVFETATLPRVDLVRHMLGRTEFGFSNRETGITSPASEISNLKSEITNPTSDISTRKSEIRNPKSEMPSAQLDAPPPHASPPLLSVRRLGRPLAVESVSFDLRGGEVLGLAGLLGSGRTETARLVFGADRPDAGDIRFDDERIDCGSPARSIRLGMGFCPEDRAAEGIIPELSVRENICLVLQRNLSRWGWVHRARQRRAAEEMIRRLRIVAEGSEQPVGQLSGGNQQKVVLARWLAVQPRLLILDEPTRGIDVGAKQAVESLVADLAGQGMAIIFISSELDEVLRASDRILVLHDRQPVGEVPRAQAGEEHILHLMAGGGEEAPKPRNAGPPSAEAGTAESSECRAAESPGKEAGTRSAVEPAAIPAGQTAASQGMDRPASRALRRWPSWTLPLLALAVFVLLDLLLVPRFGHLQFRDGRWEGAIVQILRQASPVMILSVGMTLVIALGGIDLSVGSIMAMSGAAGAIALTRHGCGAGGVIAAGLGVGLLAGAWNGALVGLLRLPAIIATLILLVAGRGLAQLPTEGLVITFESPSFERLAAGTLLGLPLPIYLALGTTLVVAVIARFTTIGLYLEAIGGSRAASYLCGLPQRALECSTYLLSGLCAALAGLIATADAKAADVSNCGLYLELDAILAVVIGGTRLTGGRIRLIGAVLGALLMQTLTTTLLMLNIAFPLMLLIKGAAALLVCLIQSPQGLDLLGAGMHRVHGAWRAEGAGAASATHRPRG